MNAPALHWYGHVFLALGAGTVFLALGLISRKLAEALKAKPHYRLYFLCAVLSLLAPLGDILAGNESVDGFTLLLGGAFVLSLAPTWLHWHWLFLGRDR